MTDKMSFGAFIWPQNPEKINVSFQNTIALTVLPFYKSLAHITAPKARIVSGSGRFTGDTADFYAAKISALQKLPFAQRLTLPSSESFDCVLSKLNIFADADEKSVKYEFEFIETDTGETGVTAHPVTIEVIKGESIYDISERLGITVGTLLLLNPSISDPFNINLEKVVIS